MVNRLFSPALLTIILLVLSVFLYTIMSCSSIALQSVYNTDEDVLNFIQLSARHGYGAEWHNVTTADGYILSVFRVLPRLLKMENSKSKPIIFLQHGVAASSDIFIAFETHNSIALLLTNAGYDVWLGNLRGNTYSRRHTSLSPDDSKFWDFSGDEYALRDLPAMIDYVLNVTEQASMTYVAHSIGSTIAMGLLADQPEYNEKLKLVVSLAPIYLTANSAGKMAVFLPFHFIKTLYPNKRDEIMPQNITAGKDREQADLGRILTLLKYWPAGSSLKVWYHGAQQYLCGQPLSRYDYGSNGNIEHYAQENVPLFNLNNINTSVAIFVAKNDPLSLVQDAEALIPNLPNIKKLIYEIIDYENFSHFDFLIAKNVKELLYDRVIQVIQSFHENQDF